MRNGKLRTMHGMELPFVFDHPDKISSMTGAGSDCAAIATAMSSAWVAFARSGNPNHSGIPPWAAFNPTTWQTMVFGSRTRAENDPWGAERREWRSKGRRRVILRSSVGPIALDVAIVDLDRGEAACGRYTYPQHRDHRGRWRLNHELDRGGRAKTKFGAIAPFQARGLDAASAMARSGRI